MFAPLAIVILLCAAWSAYWLVASSYVREKAEAERARLARSGLVLSCGEESWGGFPFRFEFACESAALRLAGFGSAEAPAMAAVAQAYNPWHVLVLAGGPARLAIGPGASLTVNRSAIASLQFRQEREPEITVELHDLVIPDVLDARSLLLSTRPEAEGSRGLAVKLQGIHHQRPRRPPLDIDQASLLGTMLPSMDLDVKQLVLKSGDVTWSGTGRVALDRDRRLAGTLHTETNDLDGLLAIIEPHVEMSAAQRQAFRSVLGLLGKQAKADVAARNGELYVGPFKIADLLPLF